MSELREHELHETQEVNLGKAHCQLKEIECLFIDQHGQT